ncbi:MAG: TraB/VirB10 family protein [Candidatus Nitrospinota bacterium M3_3B_026]
MSAWKEKALAWWEALPPGRKRAAVLSALAGTFILAGLSAWELKGGRPAPPDREETAARPIRLSPAALERSAYLETKALAGTTIEGVQDLLENFERRVDERVARALAESERDRDKSVSRRKREKTSAGDFERPGGPDTKTSLTKTSPTPGKEAGVRMAARKRPFPPPSPLPSAPGAVPPRAGSSSPGGRAEPELIGGIELVKAPGGPSSREDGGKKKEEAVYLPPSFMEASLISGLDAPTVEKARGNPMPALLRVKAPAVLPNRVKANLKGCFVIASGYGDLAAERAYLRLDTLSCISKGGESVIDQAVKGFVVDTDGKIGLRGRVVSKMGATIARSMIAGFFGGMGDVLKFSGTTTQVNPLGTLTFKTSEIDKEGVAQFFGMGAGAGLSQAAQEIQKFYLDLARQTMPVIEVGATKQVTLVVQEGASLEIKDACVGVEEGCGQK